MTQQGTAHRWRTIGELETRRLERAVRQVQRAALILKATLHIEESGEAQSPRAASTAAGSQGTSSKSWLAKRGFHLTWNPAGRSLRGPLLPTQPALRVSLRIHDLTLVLIDAEDCCLCELRLHDQTIGGAWRWLESSVEQHTEQTLESLLGPQAAAHMHALDVGDVLRGDEGAELFCSMPASDFDELARWYSNANAVLGEMCASLDDATGVVFGGEDLQLVTVGDVAGKQSPRLEVGMCPGDHQHEEPYFFVRPADSSLTSGSPLEPGEKLAGSGRWHEEGWCGAILPSSHISCPDTADAQDDQVCSFLRSALEAARIAFLP